MNKKALLGGTALVALSPSLALAQAASPVGEMLEQIDTAAIGTDIQTYGVAAIAVFLTISAIFLAKKLLGKLVG